MADSLTDERNGAAGSSQLSRGSASTLSANANVAASSDVEEPLPQKIVIHEPNDESDEPEMGPVVAALTSASSVSFFSSATFHLLTFLTVAVVAPWLGLDWLLPTEEIQPRLPVVAFIKPSLKEKPGLSS